jgi:hypothetical protein
MASDFVREDVTFLSGGARGVRCAAWWYRPARDGVATTRPRPCVVLAHGFCGVREMRLDAYAERFAAAGYAALVFDYRHFGASAGEPRQLLDIDRQLADWNAAIAFARSLDGVDAERIVLWGTSFSGGHVLVTAAADPRVAAVIAQAPHTSGPAAVASAPLWVGARLSAIALADALGARLGRAPRYVAAVGRPGALAAMTTPGAVEWLARVTPPGAVIREDVIARVLLQLPRYSPGKRAGAVRCPLLVQVATRDRLTPPGPAEAACRAAQRGELIGYPVDHFGIYLDEAFERAVGDQLAFLGRHVPVG